MFSRIFNIHSKKDSSKDDAEKDALRKLEEFQAVPRLPKLDKKKIRVLIFKDCERRSDKCLLFDSDAIVSVAPINVQNNDKDKKQHPKKQIPSGISTPVTAHDSPAKYQTLKPSGDINMLGEMIFGSVAMVYKGSILKVHLIRTPPQLLMTKVFALRSRSAGVNFCDHELSTSTSISSTPRVTISNDSISLSSQNGSPADGIPIRSYSNPIVMRKHQMNQSVSSLYNMNKFGQSTWSINSSDMTHSSSQLSTPSLNSPFGSYQRRFFRSQRTSLDSNFWRNKSEQSEEVRATFKQQPKIGVGIVFKLWDSTEDNRAFQNFFFTHYTLFEGHLQTLRMKIEKSFYLRQKFIDTALNAVECFQDDVLRLCYAPRIIEPVWLNLMTCAQQEYCITVDKFISSFMNLVELCETKQSNYFLSILLTAVLTHHSSWVATVMSTGSDAKRAYLDKHSSKTFDILAKCHPYNPLWAQLCDLYGSTGSPLKLARTIIVGKNSILVGKILHLLTYFIRCSAIKENILKIAKERESFYRFSGSSWSESHVSVTPNSVRSWIDSNDVNSGEFLHIKTQHTGKEFRNYVSTSNIDILNTQQTFTHYVSEQNSSTVASPKTLTQLDLNLESNHTPKVLMQSDGGFDVSTCYCGILKRMDSIGKKNLINMIKSSHYEEHHSKKIINTKSCSCYETLKKTMSDKFCNVCRVYQKEDLSVEIDSTCHHCLRNDLSDDTLKKSKLVSNELTAYHTATSNSGISNLELPLPRKPSFKCYCCPSDSVCSEDVTNTVQDSKEEDILTRPRKPSDPVDCLIFSKLKTGLLRNSTTSHDSGTEMACSISSSSHDIGSTDSVGLSRNTSFSSHGEECTNCDQAANDLDSDYCSVDNEHLVTTNTDDSVVDEVINCSLSKVSKSNSSTTLIDMSIALSSSLEKSGETSIPEENELIKTSLELDLDTMNLTELPFLRTTQKQSRRSSRIPTNDSQELLTFGNSLFAGYNEDYLPNFVLQGTKKLDCERLATDLKNSVKYSVLDEPVSDAVCIVANTDNWTCELWTLAKRTDSFNGNTSESLHTKPVFASGLVSSMIESTKELWDIKMAPHFCLLHLEEQLKDIYNRGKVLNQYCLSYDDISANTFMNSFGYHSNDVELLKSVFSTYVPILEDSLLQ